VRIVFSSDRSVLVSWGDQISPEAHRNVLRLFHLLQRSPAILNLHPAYASIQADFDPLLTSYSEIESTVREAARRLDEIELPAARTVNIPVVYGGEYGPDLDDVAACVGLTSVEVISRHSAADYLVYFLGFSPGFPYLGGLPPELAAPRLDSPRKEVPAGSVAIGGSQAGIYPTSSPGGWRIIGRTPARLFDPSRAEPTLLRMGDRVKFIRTENWPRINANERE
jgi:inhibitor of KinA